MMLVKLNNKIVKGFKIYTHNHVYYFIPYTISDSDELLFNDDATRVKINKDNFVISESLIFITKLVSESDWNKLDNTTIVNDARYKPIYDSNLNIIDKTLNPKLSYLSLTIAIGKNVGLLFKFKDVNGITDSLFNASILIEDCVTYYNRRIAAFTETQLLTLLEHYDMLSTVEKVKLKAVIKSLELCTL